MKQGGTAWSLVPSIGLVLSHQSEIHIHKKKANQKKRRRTKATREIAATVLSNYQEYNRIYCTHAKQQEQ